MTRTRIIIFAKAPVPGLAKTRLVPLLGPEGAARLAADMLSDTAAAAVGAGLGTPELCATPHPDCAEWDGHRPPGVSWSDQGNGDLGARLARAARRALDAGERVLLIGTDCPEMDATRLRAAAEALDSHDATINPAHDGGYVLLGLTRFDRSLFDGMAWSTGEVAAETIRRVRRLGWSLHVGETLRDVDEPADLMAWRPASSGRTARP